MRLVAGILALLSTLSAEPVSADIRLGDQLDAIRLAGSERMMVHALSYVGLPVQARIAREKILANIGLRGKPGTVSSTDFSFSPIMTHDSNINGGYASDRFTVAGIPFSIGEDYKAVGGLVIGINGTGKAHIALGHDTALTLRAGGSMGYAPEHDMFKVSLGGSACLDHMVNYSTYVNACLNATYRSYDLGDSKHVGGNMGIKHVFSSSIGVHEASTGVLVQRHLNDTKYTQVIGNFAVTTALPGPYAITAGIQLGRRSGNVMTMRQRGYLAFGLLAFERPTSVTASLQNNQGGMWLGEELSEKVSSFAVKHQFSKNVAVTTSVTLIDSSDSFFDNTQYGLNAAWRF